MSLLPSLTQSAPGVPIFAPASGGGGGGGGTDLVVSSIVVNTKNSSPGGGIAFSYDFPNNSSVIPAGMIGLQEGVISGVGIGNTNAVLVGQDNGGLAQTGDFGAARIILGTQGTGSSAVAKPILTEANGLVSIIPGISTLALNVSSINGSAPGGGGAAVSTFPNLTVSSGIVALNGTMNMTGVDNNLYAFTVSDSNVSTVASMSLGNIGGRNQFNAAVGEIPAFYTSTITGTTGVIQLNPTGTEQIRIGGLGAPGDITLNTVGGGQIVLNGAASAPITASISSLTVSSINGAAPSGGGVSVSKLSWLNSGTNTLPANGVPGTFVTLTNSSAAAINGHTYRVSASFLLSNSAADGVTAIVIDGAGIGGLPALIYQAPNVSTVNAAGAGYCGYFTVAGNSGSGFTVSGFNTGSQATVIDGDAAFVLVEDLGAL